MEKVLRCSVFIGSDSDYYSSIKRTRNACAWIQHIQSRQKGDYRFYQESIADLCKYNIHSVRVVSNNNGCCVSNTNRSCDLFNDDWRSLFVLYNSASSQ